MTNLTTPESILNAAQRQLALALDALGVRVSIASTDAGDSQSREHAIRRGSAVVASLRLQAIGTHDVAKRLDAAGSLLDGFWRAKTNETTLDQLTLRIEQAYEQSHLLFALAKIPKNAEACRAALAEAVERLASIGELGWVALCFVENDTAVAELRGRQFLAGRPPIDANTFDGLLRAEVAYDRKQVIQTAEQLPLAAATGAEVLIQPLTFEDRRLGILAAGNNGGDDPGLSSFETQLFAACAGYLDTFHANLKRIALQEQMFFGTLRALTASIDAKDPYTCGHSERVALLAHTMAKALHLDDAAAERYRIAGLIHDIGKIGVPERVLCKAGKLDDEEFAFIRKHPQIGFDILKDIPGLDDIRPGVLGHHERFDGRGYPNGIKGEEIPLLARVLALCDTFDAMSSNRSYRAKLPREQVLAEITRCAGGQFDPQLAANFVRLDFAGFDAALKSHAEQFPAAPVVLAAAA